MGKPEAARASRWLASQSAFLHPREVQCSSLVACGQKRRCKAYAFPPVICPRGCSATEALGDFCRSRRDVVCTTRAAYKSDAKLGGPDADAGYQSSLATNRRVSSLPCERGVVRSEVDLTSAAMVNVARPRTNATLCP